MRNANVALSYEGGRDKPTALAISDDQGGSCTWGDFESRTNQIAHLLDALLLPPDSRILVQIDKSAAALALYVGVLKAGLVYVPVNPAYSPAEVRHVIEVAKPSAVVCSSVNAESVRSLADAFDIRAIFTLDAEGAGSLIDDCEAMPEEFRTAHRDPDDVAAILFTSGTTGRSKGAMLTHRNLATSIDALHEAWRWQSSDVIVHALPIFHVHGLFIAAGGALHSGSTMIWMRSFDADAVIRWLPGATIFMGVPTMYSRLLDSPLLTPEACSNIRVFICGSAPLPEATFGAWEVRTGTTLLERYGMTETSMLTSNPIDGERRIGSAGLPLPGVRLRVASSGEPGAIGEVEVAGANVTPGYWRDEEQTLAAFSTDGYFRTKDLGFLDSDGYLHLIGRASDMIITRGFNVYPKEVEDALSVVPGVIDAAVFGIPDHGQGERVAVAVVLAEGSGLSPDGMRTALSECLVYYKVPSRYLLLDELPKNVLGKVQKNLLRERYSDPLL